MRLRSVLRRSGVRETLATSGGRVHLGCNTVRIDGFVNLDVRETSATDLVHDCKDLAIFPSNSLSFVYSNAFFEHVYTNDRLPLLRDALRALAPDGWLAFTGLPDFEGVARAYLERRSGNVSKLFDLYEAYRYTHGDPEGKSDWWLAQLHKGLLDTPTCVELCRSAGFATCEVFAYCWGNEPNQVTIGFLATKHKPARTVESSQVQAELTALPANINWNTLELKGGYQ